MCSSYWLFNYLGYNEMGLHYGARQRKPSFSLRERVIGDLMKALEMMKAVVGTDLEFVVQGKKKKAFGVAQSITFLLHQKCYYTSLKCWHDSSLLIRYRIRSWKKYTLHETRTERYYMLGSSETLQHLCNLYSETGINWLQRLLQLSAFPWTRVLKRLLGTSCLRVVE